MSGVFPFNSETNCQNDLFRAIISKPIKFHSSIKKNDKLFIDCLLQKNPKNRISLKMLIKALDRFI